MIINHVLDDEVITLTITDDDEMIDIDISK